MASNTNPKFAVLIDADNAQASVIQELLAEVSTGVKKRLILGVRARFAFLGVLEF